MEKPACKLSAVAEKDPVVFPFPERKFGKRFDAHERISQRKLVGIVGRKFRRKLPRNKPCERQLRESLQRAVLLVRNFPIGQEPKPDAEPKQNKAKKDRTQAFHKAS